MADRWAETGTGGRNQGKKDSREKMRLQHAHKWCVERLDAGLKHVNMAGKAEAAGQPRREVAGVQNTFHGGRRRKPGSSVGICNKTVGFPGEHPCSSCCLSSLLLFKQYLAEKTGMKKLAALKCNDRGQTQMKPESFVLIPVKRLKLNNTTAIPFNGRNVSSWQPKVVWVNHGSSSTLCVNHNRCHQTVHK